MTTTDEEIMQAALVNALALEIGTAYDCTRNWYGWRVGTMSERDFVPLEERFDEIAAGIRGRLEPVIAARTQAIAASAWSAGRDAGAIAARDAVVAIDWPPDDGDLLIDDIQSAIRALTPPAEFAAPEDKRDAEIAALKEELKLLNDELACDQEEISGWESDAEHDRAEITRLRAENDRVCAKLAERDALLRDARVNIGYSSSPWLCTRINALLKTEGE